MERTACLLSAGARHSARLLQVLMAAKDNYLVLRIGFGSKLLPLDAVRSQLVIPLYNEPPHVVADLLNGHTFLRLHLGR